MIRIFWTLERLVISFGRKPSTVAPSDLRLLAFTLSAVSFPYVWFEPSDLFLMQIWWDPFWGYQNPCLPSCRRPFSSHLALLNLMKQAALLDHMEYGKEFREAARQQGARTPSPTTSKYSILPTTREGPKGQLLMWPQAGWHSEPSNDNLKRKTQPSLTRYLTHRYINSCR